MSGLTIAPIGYALWGVAAASLSAALTFAMAWAIIKAIGIGTKLYQKWTGRGEA